MAKKIGEKLISKNRVLISNAEVLSKYKTAFGMTMYKVKTEYGKEITLSSFEVSMYFK